MGGWAKRRPTMPRLGAHVLDIELGHLACSVHIVARRGLCQQCLFGKAHLHGICKYRDTIGLQTAHPCIVIAKIRWWWIGKCRHTIRLHAGLPCLVIAKTWWRPTHWHIQQLCDAAGHKHGRRLGQSAWWW